MGVEPPRDMAREKLDSKLLGLVDNGLGKLPGSCRQLLRPLPRNSGPGRHVVCVKDNTTASEELSPAL